MLKRFTKIKDELLQVVGKVGSTVTVERSETFQRKAIENVGRD